MRFELDEKNLSKLLMLFSVSENNIDVLEFLRGYLENYPTIIERDEVMNNLASLGIDNAFVYTLISSFNLDYEHPLIKKITRDYLLKGIHHLSAKDYENNPYYKNIKIKNKKEGNWELKQDQYKAFEGFVYKSHEIVKEDYYKEIPSIGFFLKDFSFPAVYENDNMWMSVTPNEINTMKEAVDLSHGKVITFGLGLGYFTYMVSLKDDVSDVYIVEKDDKVISLFEKEILPQFEHKEKIHIIKDDAFKYMRENDMSEYDSIFVDIWHDASDGLELYLQSLKYLQNVNAMYWIEDSIILLFRKMVISLLKDAYMGEVTDYQTYRTEYLYTRHITKDDVYHSYDEIEQLLSDESLKKILIKIANIY